MEAQNNNNTQNGQNQDKQSGITFQTVFTMLLLNWQWFLLSLIICLGLGYAYLRYTTPIYQASAKLLIKDDESQNTTQRSTKSMLATSANLGIMTNSAGIDNEMEILQSRSISCEAVKSLKLYTMYQLKGRLKNHILYQNQPFNVDLDSTHLSDLKSSISVQITRKDDSYNVKCGYHAPLADGDEAKDLTVVEKQTSTFPISVGTRLGTVQIVPNGQYMLDNGQTMLATIVPPMTMATRYTNALGVAQSSKTTTIAVLTITDACPQRALDYLDALIIAYNQQANEDKNEIAVRTEEFINGRLQKISEELGNTDGRIEKFKKDNNIIEPTASATQTMQNANEYDKQLIEANTQIALLNNLSSYLSSDKNKYQVIPSNIGLSDPSTTSIITNYNKVALERNNLLHTAGESNPALKPLTAQLDELYASLKQAMAQAKKNLQIQRDAISSQYSKYNGQIKESPEQQRVMTEIGRQQQVQTSLYTMLLQKREENSISLAATADKGRLIDEPAYNGQVKPKRSIVMVIAFILGLGIPFAFFYLLNFLRYKIESHDDVTKLTTVPIIADVAVANESAKTKADVVVHENENNMMEEIFRAMRTNLLFTMTEGQKVIMCTSSIAGEGKTFNISNLAISFALLGKKVILIGLDIRKPRLAELFQIHDHHHGITPLLVMSKPTEEDVRSQIIPSGVNDNLDLMLAGPIPPNPAELLQRKQLDTVIDILKHECDYDYVLLDTAPVGLVTDSFQLARLSDATIVVCRADYTPKENIAMIEDLHKSEKFPNMSLVINGIDMSKKKHSYYYGYGRYGHYGHYGHTYRSYGQYGSYGNYGSYGSYSQSHYGDKNDHSVKTKKHSK